MPRATGRRRGLAMPNSCETTERSDDCCVPFFLLRHIRHKKHQVECVEVTRRSLKGAKAAPGDVVDAPTFTLPRPSLRGEGAGGWLAPQALGPRAYNWAVDDRTASISF